MGPKNPKRGKRKSTTKVSLTKLSNKRINRLAKQGKLKGKVHKHNYIKLLKARARGHVDPEEAERQEQIEKSEKPDIPLSEADYEYFATPGRDFSFITDVDESEKKGSKKRKQQKNINDFERQHENSSRHRLPTEIRPVLPIKTNQGIVPQTRTIDRTEDDDNEADMEGEMEDAVLIPPKVKLPALSSVQLLIARQEKLAELKNTIGGLATALVENPEENMSKLRKLRELLDNQDPDVFLTVKKIVIVSLTEVFKDIIPGYRIRIATEKEQTQAIKKETKKLRDFEEALVNNYQRFLEFLEVLIKGKLPKGKISIKKRNTLNGAIVPKESLMSMRLLATQCICDLLYSQPHFNFRTNIIACLVPLMNHKDIEVSDTVCSYMKKIFRDDRSGEITLEIVRLIGRVVKACHFNVHPKVLQSLLALKIKEVDRTPHENKAARKEKMEKMSRKDRKRKKQMQYLEKELEDAAVADDTQKRLRLNTEIVNMIFLTYFRILKMGTNSNLLPTVLEGLAKFAHLINVEFFDDLFTVLNHIVESEDLTYRESLHCVQTAFKILSGQGSALNIDPMRFYRHLYASLMELNAGVSSEDLPIALECLDIMISRRKRHISQQRLLAFTKRLTTLALQMLSNGSIATLATARTFINADTKMDLLYDREMLGNGIYMPELDDPEHCNAANTALYELHLLRRSYHPTVRQYAKHLLAKAPLQGHGHLPLELSRKLPVELYAHFDPSNVTFVPPVPSKPTNKQMPPMPENYVQSWMQERVAEAMVTVDEAQEKIFNIKQTPAKQTPAKQTPAKQMPAKQTPAKQMPAKHKAVKQTSAEQPAKKRNKGIKRMSNGLNGFSEHSRKKSKVVRTTH